MIDNLRRSLTPLLGAGSHRRLDAAAGDARRAVVALLILSQFMAPTYRHRECAWPKSREVTARPFDRAGA
jgi:hypothetical protein